MELAPITRNGKAQNWKRPNRVEGGVEAGQEQETPAAAEQRPRRRPDALDDWAEAEPVDEQSDRQARRGGGGQPAQFGEVRGRVAQPGAGDQAEYHRPQCRDETERGVTAVVEQKRLLAREEVEEPAVERPGQVRVHVPVGGEAGEVVRRRPIGGDADRLVIEVRPRQRVEDEGGPVAHEQHGQRDPPQPPRPHQAE